MGKAQAYNQLKLFLVCSWVLVGCGAKPLTGATSGGGSGSVTGPAPSSPSQITAGATETGEPFIEFPAVANAWSYLVFVDGESFLSTSPRVPISLKWFCRRTQGTVTANGEGGSSAPVSFDLTPKFNARSCWDKAEAALPYYGDLVSVGDALVLATSDGLYRGPPASLSRLTGTSSSLSNLFATPTALVVHEEQRLKVSRDQGRSWTAVQEMSSGYELGAYGNGRLVIVQSYFGEQRTKLYFSDDDARTFLVDDRLTTGPSGAISGLAYGAGRWVAIGGGGYLASSTDGRLFTNIGCVSGTSARVFFVNGLFHAYVFTSGPSHHLYSADGVNWQSETTDAVGLIGSLIAGPGNTMLAVSGGSLSSTTDGSTFTNVSLPTGELVVGLSAHAGGYVALATGSTVLTSADGQAWSRVAYRGTYEKLQVTGSRLQVFGSSGLLAESTDGSTFSKRYLPTIASVIGAVGPLVAASDGVYRDNGSSFSVVYTPSASNLVHLVRCGGTTLALGNSQDYGLTTDLNSFETLSLPGVLFAQHVVCDGTSFLVFDSSSRLQQSIYQSSNGRDWTLVGAAPNLTKVVKVGNVMMGQNANQILYRAVSVDSWSIVPNPLPAGNPRSLAASGSEFYIGTNDAYIPTAATSQDGVTFETQVQNQGPFTFLATLNNKSVALSFGGDVLTQ